MDTDLTPNDGPPLPAGPTPERAPTNDAPAAGHAPVTPLPEPSFDAVPDLGPDSPETPESPDTPEVSESVVRCLKLTKIFRDFWHRQQARAVDAIDLDIRRGEVFGLLGPNGSGKTTTIKMTLGLLYPTSGHVWVFGKKPDHVRTKRLIGYLPEESHLYRFLTARETLDFYGCLFGLPRQQRRRRIDMLLEMVGLTAAQNRPVGEFSAGMQRRVGLAQALINDPQLLILDEPTAGLDPIGTRQIKDLIRQLAQRGKTILLCSHLLADVEDVCHRVAIMFGGKICVCGSVDQLLVRQESTTIQTQALDERTIEKIESVLESAGKHIDKVQHPRQKLEALFLEVIQRATAAGFTTSGATPSGRLAPFLLNAPLATLPAASWPGELAPGPHADQPRRNESLNREFVSPEDHDDDLTDTYVIDQLTHSDEDLQVEADPDDRTETWELEELPDNQASTPPQAPAPSPETSDESEIVEAVIDDLTEHEEPGQPQAKPYPSPDPTKQTASPPVDESVINDLVTRSTAASTPQPHQPPPQPEPTPPAAQPAPASKPPASKTTSSARGKEASEAPFQSFIEAVSKVTPYDPTADPENPEGGPTPPQSHGKPPAPGRPRPHQTGPADDPQADAPYNDTEFVLGQISESDIDPPPEPSPPALPTKDTPSQDAHDPNKPPGQK